MTAIPAAGSSDLKLRATSSLVMVGVAASAFAAGGMIFSVFVALVALLAAWEWWSLSGKLATSPVSRAIWSALGGAYIGGAALLIIMLRSSSATAPLLLALIGIVIATDVGAYAVGRTVGGPKIAPAISPSKTWAGLVGGMASASIFTVSFAAWLSTALSAREIVMSAIFGATLAVVAQAGDFFESWMKRRAGVKDSGRLIPGHGGILDRVDGLVPVIIVGTGLFLSMTLWMLGR